MTTSLHSGGWRAATHQKRSCDSGGSVRRGPGGGNAFGAPGANRGCHAHGPNPNLRQGYRLNRGSGGAPGRLAIADAAHWSFWRRNSQSLFKKLLKNILEKQYETSFSNFASFPQLVVIDDIIINIISAENISRRNGAESM